MDKVIIVGGGPVGLSAAISLARQGIGSVLIEKHPSTTHHPKARGVNGRTMELFRLWGIEKPLKQCLMTRDAYRFTWLESLQTDENIHVSATVDYSLFSATENAIIAQDDVEEELFKKAQCLSLIDLKFNTEMLEVSQECESVAIKILNKETNQEETLSSQYLIAADGANSPIRKELNIEMEGVDNLGTFINIFCEMDLDKYVKDRPSVGYMFTKPDLRGSFLLAKEGLRKWLVGARIEAFPDLTKESFTDELCIDFVKKVINDPEVEVTLLNKAFWTMAALIAKQYRVGRIFLAGDSAHRLPPTGGFGMNTGIQDAHNLAWKLAMVINNQANDTLLDTYYTERVQIAKANMLWSMNNAKRFETIFTALAKGDMKTFKDSLEDQAHHINNILLDLGFIYGSEYQDQDEYKPSTQIGARAPHLWLEKDSQKISTLDLFDHQFVLVCHPNSQWIEKYQDFPCRVITIGDHGEYQDVQHDFLKSYEISEQGAVLVRPDGHVAWKSCDESGEMASFSWLK